MDQRNPRSQRILMVSSEVESLARTGGLGDVVEALSLSLARQGAEVLVVTPRYGVTRMPRTTHPWASQVPVRVGWGDGGMRRVSVIELETSRFACGGSRRICLVDDPSLFAREGIYGDGGGEYGDNALRFAVMSRASLEIAAHSWPSGPDVIHAHDWHAALVILYARLRMGEVWEKKPSVFTIHNLAYQGVLDEGALERLELPRELHRPEYLEHEGNVNLMKGAIALADALTTVSPTYAREILTPEGGFGLDAHLRGHAARLHGIRNGVDTRRFSPRLDDAIAVRYDAATAAAGKAACKAALAAELGLEPGDGPLFATVSRLTWQKGIDLLLPLLGDLVARGARVVLVGQGERDLERGLRWAENHFPGRVASRITFDPPLSRRIYAGADFFFVPSRFEPCGLTQMYAMRYGAIPIVTDVGGLHDTVTPVRADGSGQGEGSEAPDPGIGFVAPVASSTAIWESCVAALSLHRDPAALARVRAAGMAEDFSWEEPARAYADLYASLVAPRS